MQAAQTMEHLEKARLQGDAEQFLTFEIEGEEYAVDILRVQEIKGWDEATRVPRMPPYVKGVINLRGTIVPIVDLRERFSLKPAQYGPKTVVIVLRVVHQEQERVMGVVVDSVSDVHTLEDHALRPPPSGRGSDAFVRGFATINGHMLIVLDIDLLLATEELVGAHDNAG